MTKSIMHTLSGKAVDLLNPTPADIDFHDIAHSLSLIPRYLGHSSRPYSVAEHSIHVASLLPENICIYGLLHDAHEAYIGDITSPMKRALNHSGGGNFWYALSDIEQPFMRAIYTAAGVDPEPHQSILNAVKYADETMLVTEMRQLFKPVPDFGELGKLPSALIDLSAKDCEPADWSTRLTHEIWLYRGLPTMPKAAVAA